MVSRLAVLTHLIGDDPCWNCKSGKDRTGNCDVEAKYLVSEIHMTGDVPEPDPTRTDQDRDNFFRLAIDGGNFELQAYNTGAPGFKLGGVDALARQIGVDKNDPRYKFFRGISDYYGS